MTDSPRVAQVITRMNIGGVARHVKLLHERVDPAEFELTLLTGRASSREGTIAVDADTERTEDVPGLQRRPNPYRDARAFRHLRGRLNALSPSIVHTHMMKAGVLGRIAARRVGVPVVVHTFHGHVVTGYFPKPISKGIAVAERRLARRTDALVAVSDAVRDELLEMGIGKPGQWHVIPYRLDLNELLEDTPPADAARRALGLPEAGPVVGIAGRLVPIKDHATFLDAAVRVAEVRPDATFVIAGDGELRHSLETRSRRLLGERVRFLGWVPDLKTLYGALDVVVLTSRNEGTPFALIEAGAAGKPVVATAVGGVPDVVRDGKTGYLAPPGDAEAVATAVLGLLSQPQAARALGAAARPWVRARFSADMLVGEVVDLYKELLARAGAEADRRMDS